MARKQLAKELVWEVEKILGVKETKVHTICGAPFKFMVQEGLKFYVKWKGYSLEESTWEPIEHLRCPNLLRSFIDGVIMSGRDGSWE